MARRANPSDEQRATRSWDRTWRPHLDAEPLDLDRPTLENHIDARKLRFLGDDLPRSGRAVEIGCGSARLLARVGRAAPLELVAVDTSDTALRVARQMAARLGLTLSRVQADAHSLPFVTETVDLVLSGGLLEHFADPRPVLAEMVRVLRPGGLFYADVVPRKLSLYRLREAPRMARSPWLLPGVFESSLGPRWYEAALRDLGCRAIRVEAAGVYPPWRAAWWAPRATRLDGTWIAGLLGWYFMIAARRP